MHGDHGQVGMGFGLVALDELAKHFEMADDQRRGMLGKVCILAESKISQLAVAYREKQHSYCCGKQWHRGSHYVGTWRWSSRVLGVKIAKSGLDIQEKLT